MENLREDHFVNYSFLIFNYLKIIGSYKSAVTNHANRLGLPHQWQSLFHDHIIRNDLEYQRISNYIVNNPGNWNDDKFNNKK